ncbi:MAG: lipopolysaccharide biosynthesis protein, partial [Dolichospermum sp.]
MLTPKIQYWIKTLSKFISIQLIVQALNLGSGILIIRTLSKQEYAYFTLANAMQATMNTLADSGIGSALSAIGGRVWQDPYRFGQLINTAMYLRRYLAVIATLVVTPILFWMLLQNGASIGYTLLLISAILIELYFYLNIGVLIVVPRLYSKIDKLQQLSLLSSGSRFLFLIGGSLIFLNALVGAFSSTVASGLENLMLWFSVKDTIDVKSEINKEDKIEILKIVKTQAPNTIFYCIQGQVTIWLITVFGNTDNIAEVGALGRLAVIFSLITSIMTNIVLPSFSRTQSYEILIRKYKQIIFSYVFLSLMILLLSMFFPKQLLLILGKNYSSLEKELFFFAIAAVTNAITSILWSINASKGWTEEAWLFVPT